MSKPLLSVTLKDVLSKLVSFSVDLVISWRSYSNIVSSFAVALSISISKLSYKVDSA
jgi:hypothetical protein